ncbi:NAD(P)/FAD-dependent oxidoreductase [Microbacterium sp.]|uniref:FAD-dependent oxidoreductase n=1 Tax=Microbacterium sp. TaxID=51671 RepID=UPI002634475F|nr:NAD(P)/FAD-dependent oxidoreductase [Microbacterium sp.]
MLIDTALQTQLDAQRDDRLRVLIVGAGVAGLTLAALLRRGGLHPAVIERMPSMAHPGYMLALMPIVDVVFDDLGIHEQYVAHSSPLSRYAFRSHTGKTLRSDDLGDLMSMHGDYQGIERGELIDLLTADGMPVSFGTTVSSVAFDDTTSHVSFTGTDAAASVDLVVAADGIHSRTRDLLPVGDVAELDTGWGGWVSWCDPIGDPALGEEMWGDGSFLGVYPVKDRLGVFLGGPVDDTRSGQAAFADRVRSAAPHLDDRMHAALNSVTADDDPYFWPLTDVRAERWVARTGTGASAVLLGDAAAGFLPTAGIGAAMAMESAWMLGRMLTPLTERDDRLSSLPTVLAAWERIEKPRVESAQQNSRMLAKLMFRRGSVTAWLREAITRMLTVRAALGPIIGLVADQPDPDAVFRRAFTESATTPQR